MANKKRKKEKQQRDSEEYTGVALNFADLRSVLVDDIRNIRKTLLTEHFLPRKYTRSEVLKFLENPQACEKQLREVSHYLLITSQYYRRLVSYFATMLTLDYIIVPVGDLEDPSPTAIETIKRNYRKVLKHLENFNVKHEFSKVLKVLMVDGVYFGYERQAGDSFVLQRLPANYCKITGIQDGLITFAFDFNYFNGSPNRNIDDFPEEFKELKERAKRTQQNWQELDPSKAVCFKFDEEELAFSVPPFAGIFDELMALEDYKDLKLSKTKLENFKLLVQKIPMKKDAKSETDFILTLDSVKVFHQGLKSAVPSQVGVVSTPMEIEMFDFKKDKSEEDYVATAEQSFYTAAGVSKTLFNPDKSAIGINKSIEVDGAFMFPILRQFERYLKNRLSSYKFKVIMPDLTIYNREQMFKHYLQAAQYGYPKSFVAASLGMPVHDLMNMSVFETNFLNLQDTMIPLSSSHTSSARGGQGGRPRKDEDELTDAGLETRDKEKNEGRT